MGMSDGDGAKGSEDPGEPQSWRDQVTAMIWETEVEEEVTSSRGGAWVL